MSRKQYGSEIAGVIVEPIAGNMLVLSGLIDIPGDAL